MQLYSFFSLILLIAQVGSSNGDGGEGGSDVRRKILKNLKYELKKYAEIEVSYFSQVDVISLRLTRW